MAKKRIVLYLEHDTRKPIKQRLKSKGFGGIRFARKIARWMKQGYRLVRVEGDPKDPIVQYIQKSIDTYEKAGKVKVVSKEVLLVASKTTGAKVEDIKKKVDGQLGKWKKKFKGVIDPNE